MTKLGDRVTRFCIFFNTNGKEAHNVKLVNEELAHHALMFMYVPQPHWYYVYRNSAREKWERFVAASEEFHRIALLTYFKIHTLESFPALTHALSMEPCDLEEFRRSVGKERNAITCMRTGILATTIRAPRKEVMGKTPCTVTDLAGWKKAKKEKMEERRGA